MLYLISIKWNCFTLYNSFFWIFYYIFFHLFSFNYLSSLQLQTNFLLVLYTLILLVLSFTHTPILRLIKFLIYYLQYQYWRLLSMISYLLYLNSHLSVFANEVTIIFISLTCLPLFSNRSPCFLFIPTCPRCSSRQPSIPVCLLSYILLSFHILNTSTLVINIGTFDFSWFL